MPQSEKCYPLYNSSNYFEPNNDYYCKDYYWNSPDKIIEVLTEIAQWKNRQDSHILDFNFSSIFDNDGNIVENKKKLLINKLRLASKNAVSYSSASMTLNIVGNPTSGDSRKQINKVISELKELALVKIIYPIHILPAPTQAWTTRRGVDFNLEYPGQDPLIIDGINNKETYILTNEYVTKTNFTDKEGEPIQPPKIIMKGGFISPSIEYKTKIHSLGGINALKSTPHENKAFFDWNAKQTEKANREEFNEDKIQHISTQDERKTEESLRLVSDILQDDEFLSALKGKVIDGVPYPYHSLEDFLNAIPVYNNNAYIDKFLKDILDLRSGLKAISPQKNQTTVFQEQQLIDTFKSQHPKLFNPTEIILGIPNPKHADYIENIKDIGPDALSVMSESQLKKISNEDEKLLKDPGDIMGESQEEDNDLKLEFSSACLDVEIEPLELIQLLVRKKVSEHTLRKYDIARLRKKLRSSNEKWNNLTRILQNHGKITSAVTMGTSTFPLLVLNFFDESLEYEKLGYTTKNATNSPKKTIEYHHSVALKDLDDNQDTKPTSQRNKVKRATMIRFLAHQFEALQTKSKIDNLENELLMSETGVLTSEDVLGLEEEINRLREAKPTSLPPQDIEIIKSFSTNNSFGEPLRSLISDFNDSAKSKKPSRVSISYLASKTIIATLTDPQINLPKTSPLIDTLIDGERNFPEMIKFISDQDNYDTPDKLTLVGRKVSDLNDILNQATAKFDESTGLEERLIVENFNPEFIFRQNLKVRYSLKMKNNKDMVGNSMKERVIEIDTSCNELINKLTHRRPHNVYKSKQTPTSEFKDWFSKALAIPGTILKKSKLKLKNTKKAPKLIKDKVLAKQPLDLAATGALILSLTDPTKDKYPKERELQNQNALTQLQTIKKHPNITTQKHEFLNFLEKMISGGVMHRGKRPKEKTKPEEFITTPMTLPFVLNAKTTAYYQNLTQALNSKPEEFITIPTFELIMNLGGRFGTNIFSPDDEQTLLKTIVANGYVEEYIRGKVEDLCKDSIQQDYPDTIFSKLSIEKLMRLLDQHYKHTNPPNDVKNIMNACHIHAGKSIQQVQNINNAAIETLALRQKMNEYYKKGQLINSPCADFSQMSISKIETYLKSIFNENWQELPDTSEREQDNDQSLPSFDSKEKQLQSEISHWLNTCKIFPDPRPKTKKPKKKTPTNSR